MTFYLNKVVESAMRERVRHRERIANFLYENNKLGSGQRKFSDHNKGTTDLYFTNFPDHLKHEDLWKIFLRWGRAIDIYVPPRKDSFGRRFGFVKFIDVQNPKELEEKLDNIWNGTYKLRVNFPKYVRGIGSEAVKLDPVIRVSHEGNFYGRNIDGNRSYARVVVGGRSYDLPKRSETGAHHHRHIITPMNLQETKSGLMSDEC